MGIKRSLPLFYEYLALTFVCMLIGDLAQMTNIQIVVMYIVSGLAMTVGRASGAFNAVDRLRDKHLEMRNKKQGTKDDR